jgi:hypothetical protein
VANLSLDKDVVHEFSLHYSMGSSSAGRFITGGDMEVLSCLLLGAMLAGFAEAVDQLDLTGIAGRLRGSAVFTSSLICLLEDKRHFMGEEMSGTGPVTGEVGE